MIFEAELSCNQRLRVEPAEVSGNFPELNSHAIKILNKQGDMWMHREWVSIPKGKMEEIEEAARACIEDPDKMFEVDLDERHLLRLGPTGLVIVHPDMRLHMTVSISRKAMIEFKETVSEAIGEEEKRLEDLRKSGLVS